MLEGECYKSGEFFRILFRGFIVCIAIITIPVIAPVTIIWYVRTVKNWRVYLTHKSVTYHITTPYSLLETDWVIPLSEILDASLETFCSCCTKNVLLLMDPTNLAKYATCYNMPEGNCLVLRNIANADAFIAAVKREKGL